jgi:predicted RNA-binding protein YlqC (UPF0109 family)
MPVSDEIAIEKIRALLSHIVSALVDDSDQVNVEAVTNRFGIQFLVRVGAQNRGQVIGKQGRLARSLRTVLNDLGSKHGLNFTLNIEEPK